MGMPIPIWLIWLIILAVLIVIWKERSLKRHKVVIKSPKLGILNLRGLAASDDIAVDRSAISNFFSSIEESERVVPSCDVLFMYCDLTADGAVVGSESNFRELIRDSGATVVVLASNNSSDHYSAASKSATYGKANLVVTFDRRGEGFSSYIKKLFEYMSQGISMAVAWEKMSPQVPGLEHEFGPSAMLFCERGAVAFGSPIAGRD